MLERRLQEIELLRKIYGSLEYGPNVEWILFKEFKLPPGWDRDVSELLLIIPPAYPTTPPDNFYMPTGFRTKSGAQPGNYTESVAHVGRQWGQFSYHIDGEWRPAADIMLGDNLLTFMLKVMERLREAN